MEMDEQTNDGQWLESRQKIMEDGESCLKNKNCLVATHCGIASYLPGLKGSISKLPTAINTMEVTSCDHELATLPQGFQTCQFIVMWELLTCTLTAKHSKETKNVPCLCHGCK